MNKISKWTCAAMFSIVASTAVAGELEILAKQLLVSQDASLYSGDVEMRVRPDSAVRFESTAVEQQGGQTVYRGGVKISFDNTTISTDTAVVTMVGQEMHLSMAQASVVSVK